MQLQAPEAETTVLALQPVLSDKEVAHILVMTLAWVRNHADEEIPGLQRFGSYYRFRRSSIEHWLGGLDPLLEAEQVAALLKVPTSWVYANAGQIPGVVRLGRYVRFRPAVIKQFLGGSELAQ